MVHSLSSVIRKWFVQRENQLLLLILLAAFPLYYELGRNPVQVWDESRVAMNALEMARDGNWLVPHFEGVPDHWNTKPPLLIWLQALSFKVFGYTTSAFRFPTLLASLATIGVLFRFASKVLERPVAGLFAVLVLVTCAGYVRGHVARTGDYDALLTLWQVLLWTSFFQYVETGNRRHLIWLTVSMVAATMTKGPASFLGLPGLLVYAILRGKLGWLLRQSSVYGAVSSWLVIIGSYFLIRESVDPGYWQAVQENDLGGRFNTTLDSHQHPWDFYLKNFQERFFKNWLWALAPALLAVSLLEPTKLIKRAVGLLLAFMGSWLVIISAAKTKLEWYDAPIYPAMALLLGLGLSKLYQDLLTVYLPRLTKRTGLLVQLVFFVVVFYTPFYAITRQIIEERHSDYGDGPDGHLGRYIVRLKRDQPRLDRLTLLTHGNNNTVLLFYKSVFELTPGRKLSYIPGDEALKLPQGSVVTTCDPAFRVPLDSAFQVLELHQNGPCQTLLLLPR